MVQEITDQNFEEILLNNKTILSKCQQKAEKLPTII